MRNNVLETLKQFIELLYTRLTISTPPPTPTKSRRTKATAPLTPQEQLAAPRAAPQPPAPEPALPAGLPGHGCESHSLFHYHK